MGEDIPLLAEDTDGGWEVVEDGSTQVGSPFFGVQVTSNDTLQILGKYRESSLTPSLIVSDVAFVQGGVALGPVKLSAGVGAGR